MFRDIKKEIQSLNSRFESFREEFMDEQIRLKEENKELKTKLERLEVKFDRYEAQSRRNNIIIHGLEGVAGESWDDTEKLARDFMNDGSSLKPVGTTRRVPHPGRNAGTYRAAQGVHELHEVLENQPMSHKVGHSGGSHFEKGLQNVPTCLPRNTTTLLLSHNKLKLPNQAFVNVSFLKVLDLSFNDLKYLNANSFYELSELESLNLESNYLNYDNDTLPPTLFNPLSSLLKLSINNNSKGSPYPDATTLKPMPFLYYLDLSNNKLQRLSTDTTNELDKFPNVTVSLRGNPIQCSCRALDFLRWMNANQNKFSGLSEMACEYDNGSSISMTKLHQIVEELTSECSRANAALGIVTASSCVCIVLIICIALGYRHRWSIRYMYYIGRRRFWRQHPVEEVLQYQYDVFVSYAESDRHIVIQEMIPELETKAGLRMCIHHRDFLPGEAIASNIVNAIDKSRKTLIVLSPAFLKSDWCVFEYHIALQSRVNRRQDNLLILMYQHVPVKDMPREMAVLLSNNSYLEYNTDVYGRDAFWQNLVESVKTAQPLE
ncbi:toll-like receptor 4 [Haliotis cracherodii]|uniref:toll-like receptor 4 n=1 Tax=Haliotis cracherodii TaxID=6455 RepID=UPI0039EB2F36